MLEDLRRHDLPAQSDLQHIRSELETAAALVLAEIVPLTRRAKELRRRLGVDGKSSHR